MPTNGFLRSAMSCIALLTATAAPLCCQPPGAGAATLQGDAVTSPRPLADVADVLQSRYGKAVTYEDPVWEWRGDLEPSGADPSARWGLFPMRRTVSLPPGLSPDQTPTLDAAAVRRVLDEYNKGNDAPRFGVAASSFGLHIIPTTVRDASGRPVQARNPLDSIVTIPEAGRTASEHFGAICSAATKAAGIKLQCVAMGVGDNWFERLFAAPGGVLGWGVNGVTARDALIALLSQSATTFSWRFRCQPSALPDDRFCAVNLGRIQITSPAGAGGRGAATLEYDRCPKCAPVPQGRRSR